MAGVSLKLCHKPWDIQSRVGLRYLREVKNPSRLRFSCKSFAETDELPVDTGDTVKAISSSRACMICRASCGRSSCQTERESVMSFCANAGTSDACRESGISDSPRRRRTACRGGSPAMAS